MFKKLRIKFIAITMVMVAIVMALSFSVVCFVEYQRSYSVVQEALQSTLDEGIFTSERANRRFDSLEFVANQRNDQNNRSGQSGQKGDRSFGDAQNNGRSLGSIQSSQSAESGQNSDQSAGNDQSAGSNQNSSQSAGGGENSSQTAGSDQVSSDSFDPIADGNTPPDVDIPPEILDNPPDEDMRQFAPPEIGNRRGQQRASSSIVPIAVYKIEDDGSFTVIPEVTSATITSEVLEDATSQLASASDGFGTLQSVDLHYLRATTIDDVTFLAFADTSYTDSWKTLAAMLALVGLGTMVVFFVISLFYSKWALRPVREAWDSQRQFVADASHDLKTPLTVILANAAILLKHPDHSIASESQWIESTQVEAENMQGLVNEMLELAQVEDGQNRELVRNPIDLSDLLDGETLLFDSVALEQNCAFDCSIEEGVTILGDEKQITKMMATLIENAFKYVDAGGAVDITLRKSGKNALVAIRNTGSTISEEDLPHIFDRFYRTDKARTSGAGGFGLGLAISREIAVQHGGDITCTSSEAQGTTFTVTLPVA